MAKRHRAQRRRDMSSAPRSRLRSRRVRPVPPDHLLFISRSARRRAHIFFCAKLRRPRRQTRFLRSSMLKQGTHVIPSRLAGAALRLTILALVLLCPCIHRDLGLNEQTAIGTLAACRRCSPPASSFPVAPLIARAGVRQPSSPGLLSPRRAALLRAAPATPTLVFAMIVMAADIVVISRRLRLEPATGCCIGSALLLLFILTDCGWWGCFSWRPAAAVMRHVCRRSCCSHP